MDLLDQMELVDVSDQETLDVFFSSGGDEGLLTSPLPGMRQQVTDRRADLCLANTELLIHAFISSCLDKSTQNTIQPHMCC